MKSILDTHCHTLASGHAYSTVTEYVQEAVSKNLKLIAMTDHAPEMPGSAGYMHFLNQKVIPGIMQGIRVLSGVELNIMDIDGCVDLRPGILRQLDVVIASLHYPCFPPSSVEKNTRAVIETMKNPLIRVIGHLGDPRYPMDYEKVIQTAVETETAIEVNNSSLLPSNARFGGEHIVMDILKLCRQKKAFVILGSDAHFHMDLGRLDLAETLVEKAAIPEEQILNLSLERFDKFFHLSAE